MPSYDDISRTPLNPLWRLYVYIRDNAPRTDQVIQFMDQPEQETRGLLAMLRKASLVKCERAARSPRMIKLGVQTPEDIIGVWSHQPYPSTGRFPMPPSYQERLLEEETRTRQQADDGDPA